MKKASKANSIAGRAFPPVTMIGIGPINIKAAPPAVVVPSPPTELIIDIIISEVPIKIIKKPRRIRNVGALEE